MSKLLLTISLMSVLALSANSQKRFNSQIDSLLNRLSQTKGIEKVDVLNEVSSTYQQLDPKKSITYAEQASALAVKHQYDHGYILAQLNIGKAYLFLRKIEKSKLYTRRAYTLSVKKNMLKGKYRHCKA